MGWSIQQVKHTYQPRKGLEGPFQFASGRVLYYDTREGQYWDPRTDFYVGVAEMQFEHEYLVQRLKHPASA